MNHESPSPVSLSSAPGIDRRLFLQGGLAALAGVFLLGDIALADLLDVRVTRQQAGGATPAEAGSGLEARPRPVDPLAAPFLNEKIDFDLTFMGAKLAAGAITFVRSSTWAYTATIDARITGAVSPLINLRQQTMTARMIVQNIAGHDRFVTGTFTRHTVTADKTIDRVHEFNYFHRRWIYTYTENGRRPRTERRRIAPNVFYDDFANILYNTRAQVYAPFGSGQVAVVHTIPWTKTVKQDNGAKKKVRADSLTLVFPKPADYSAEERDWMKDHKADTLIVAKLDRDVYEIKAGEAKFIGDKNGKPIAAWIKDALLYGDVRATARR